MNCSKAKKNDQSFINTDIYLPMQKNEDDYISQFISVSWPSQQIRADAVLVDMPDSSNFQQSKNKSAARSQFHNFQKHLITTIRRIVMPKFPKNQNQANAGTSAAKEIWRIFQQTKKYTKQFLSAITNPQTSKKVLDKYGLSEIYQKYGEIEFENAQQFLRNQIISTFKKNQYQDLLYDRRLLKKNQFEDYLRKTINGLQGGAIQRRFTKSRVQNST